MDAPHPACQVALIGEARFCGYLGKAELSIPNHFYRALQSQMDDITIRGHADESGERAREMKLTAISHLRKRCNVKAFGQTCHNEFF